MVVTGIAYENAIVTFLDILGFSSLVSTSSAEETANVLNAVEYFSDPTIRFPEEGAEPNRAIVHIFSDTIVRVRPIERDDNRKFRTGILFQELYDLVHIQSELINHGVVLRGSVSFGPIYVNESRVFGPALIRAYELENNCAVFPRIVLDPQLLSEFENNELLRSEWNSFQDEYKSVYQLLQEGEDAFWFIDYLRGIGSELDEPEMYPDLLKTHKNLIITQASELTLPKNVIQKFMWLARYHNHLVNSLKNEWFRQFDIDSNDLLIANRDIDTMVNTGIIVQDD